MSKDVISVASNSKSEDTLLSDEKIRKAAELSIQDQKDMAQRAKLKEKLAAIEHERWADWQKWVHDCGIMKHVNGLPYLCIPSEIIGGWNKQIETNYTDLTDREKASDMEQVDRYWPLIEELIEAECNKARIDEIDYLIANMVLPQNKHGFVADRIKELTKELEK